MLILHIPVFRKRSPYKWEGKGSIVQRNSVRLAEVSTCSPSHFDDNRVWTLYVSNLIAVVRYGLTTTSSTTITELEKTLGTLEMLNRANSFVKTCSASRLNGILSKFS